MQRTDQQKVYSAADILADLQGMTVRYWDDNYAEELLKRFFPVESNQSIDFTLQD